MQRRAAQMGWHDVVVGVCFVDLLGEGALPVELKTVKALDDARRMHSINCRKPTGLPLCLPLDVSKPRLETKGVAHDR